MLSMQSQILTLETQTSSIEEWTAMSIEDKANNWSSLSEVERLNAWRNLTNDQKCNLLSQASFTTYIYHLFRNLSDYPKQQAFIAGQTFKLRDNYLPAPIYSNFESAETINPYDYIATKITNYIKADKKISKYLEHIQERDGKKIADIRQQLSNISAISRLKTFRNRLSTLQSAPQSHLNPPLTGTPSSSPAELTS